jgi:hypothetical protein
MKHQPSAARSRTTSSHLAENHSERIPDSPSFQREVSRLLSAAIVSQSFAESLLRKPAEAIDAGYQGYEYQFGLAERQVIGSIYASTIQEFAVELVDRLLCSTSPVPAKASVSDLGTVA